MNTENNQFVTKQDLKEVFEDFFIKIITHVDHKIETEINRAVNGAVASLKAFIMEGFTAMGEQMDHIEGRLDTVIKRVDHIEEHTSSLDSRLGTLEVRFDAMGQQIDSMGRRIDAMGKRIDGMDNRLYAIEESMSSVDNRLGQIAEVLIPARKVRV